MDRTAGVGVFRLHLLFLSVITQGAAYFGVFIANAPETECRPFLIERDQIQKLPFIGGYAVPAAVACKIGLHFGAAFRVSYPNNSRSRNKIINLLHLAVQRGFIRRKQNDMIHWSFRFAEREAPADERPA